MLLIDGVKYEQWLPEGDRAEEEFEKVFENHAEDIFGKDAKYFDLKHKLASRSGTGSIPDGYVITLGDKPKVQIIEFELESHSLQHIVSQMVNIINGIENSTTQQKICNAIEDGINEDEIFAAKIAKAIKPIAIHRFLSDTFSNTLPIVNIIIDQSWSALEEAVSKISPTPKIIEFKTFIRVNVGLPVHAHIFEPLYKAVVSTKLVIPLSPSTQPIPLNGNTIEIIIREPFIRAHYLPIRKNNRQFFPGYRIPFTLETDINTIQSYMCSAPVGTQVGDPNKGAYFQANLGQWYKRHVELKAGDKVRISVIEPMKKYRLEIVR